MALLRFTISSLAPAALAMFRRCCYGLLAALVLQMSLYRQGYLTPEERAVMCEDYLDCCAQTVGGAQLLLRVELHHVVVQIERGPDAQGSARHVRIHSSSWPSDYTGSGPPRAGSLVEYLVQARRGDIPGVDATAKHVDAEDSPQMVRDMFARMRHDGKWIFTGRGISVASSRTPLPTNDGECVELGSFGCLDDLHGATVLIDRADGLQRVTAKLTVGLAPLPVQPIEGRLCEQPALVFERVTQGVPRPLPRPRQSAIEMLVGQQSEARRQLRNGGMHIAEQCLQRHEACCDAMSALRDAPLLAAAAWAALDDLGRFADESVRGSLLYEASAALLVLFRAQRPVLTLPTSVESGLDERTLGEAVLVAAKQQLALAREACSADDRTGSILRQLELASMQRYRRAHYPIGHSAANELEVGEAKLRCSVEAALHAPTAFAPYAEALTRSVELLGRAADTQCTNGASYFLGSWRHAEETGASAVAEELERLLPDVVQVGGTNEAGLLIGPLVDAATGAAEGDEGAKRLLALLRTEVVPDVVQLHSERGVGTLIGALVGAATGAAEGDEGAFALLTQLCGFARALGAAWRRHSNASGARPQSPFSTDLPTIVERFVPASTNEQQHVVLLLQAAAAASSAEREQTIQAVGSAMLTCPPSDWVKLSPPAPSALLAAAELAAEVSQQPSAAVPSWSAAEDETLRALHKQYGNKWQQIACLLPGRSRDSVSMRFKRLTKAKLPREMHAPFTTAEDALLVELVTPLNGKGNIPWLSLAKQFPGRTPLELKNKWSNAIQSAAKKRKRE